MNCGRCLAPATALGTEPGTYGTVRRRYACEHGHHFTTLEAYEPQGPSIERVGLMNALRTIQQRFSKARRTA